VSKVLFFQKPITWYFSTLGSLQTRICQSFNLTYIPQILDHLRE
jgi:hypothetical protein